MMALLRNKLYCSVHLIFFLYYLPTLRWRGNGRWADTTWLELLSRSGPPNNGNDNNESEIVCCEELYKMHCNAMDVYLNFRRGSWGGGHHHQHVVESLFFTVYSGGFYWLELSYLDFEDCFVASHWKPKPNWVTHKTPSIELPHLSSISSLDLRDTSQL